MWNSGRLIRNTGVLMWNTGVLWWNTSRLGQNTGVLWWNTGRLSQNTGVLWWNTSRLSQNTGVLWWNIGRLNQDTGVLWWNTSRLRCMAHVYFLFSSLSSIAGSSPLRALTVFGFIIRILKRLSRWFFVSNPGRIRPFLAILQEDELRQIVVVGREEE